MTPDLLTPQALHQMVSDLGVIDRIDSDLASLDLYLQLGPDRVAVRDFGEAIRMLINQLHCDHFGENRAEAFASGLFSSGRMALVTLFALRNALAYERELLSSRLDGYVQVPAPFATQISMREIWQLFERGTTMEAGEDVE